MSNIDAKEALAASAPVIKVFVDTFLTPKLEELKDKLSIEYKKNIIGIEKYLTEYFERVYNKYSIINTLVFNNSEKLLKDLYIPLTLKQVVNKEKRYRIDGFPFQLAQKNKRILITDTAGMGKSTLVKRILLDIIDTSVGIPIIIELRRLNKDKTILNELHEQLNSINKLFDEKLLLELLTWGDFIFFFDGFDEIALSDRDKVTQDIQQFTSKANSNRFFMTSRPESALSSFGDFQQFSIEPLFKNEAYQLLKNYDNNGPVSSLLIRKLRQSEFRNIDEFLTNPLLVSLLFTAFEYKQVIPFKKHIFYRQVYDANFESHDLTKGDSFMHDKNSKLDIDDFHRVLRHIGFSCLKLQKIEFSKDELLKLISQSQTFCTGLKFKESDFLKDLISTVPLFTKDGVYYRWSHKSLQEYFAAQFIYLDAKQFQMKILELISQGPDADKHYNVLDIYYDIDYKSFRDIIILPLLREFKIHYERLRSLYKASNENNLIIFCELTFPTVCHALIRYDNRSYSQQIESFIKKYEFENDLSFTESVVRLLGDDAKTGVYSIQLFDHKFNILSILRSKRNDVFKNFSTKLTEKDVSKGIRVLIKDMPIIIDSRLKNIEFTNDLEVINEILLYALVFGGSLSYKKAINMLSIIEKEQLWQERGDYILSGL